jgi:peptide/nickel transport system substrate-binding protein
MAVQILRTLLGIILVLAVACGTAEAPDPTAAPAAQAPLASPDPAARPTEEAEQPAPTATPISQPTVTPSSSDMISARDSITLVVGAEPVVANPLLPIGAGTTTPLIKDNLVDPLTWQSADDLRIVPTTATESWKQLDPETWRFQLREGVTFHNGEGWNAQAALPTLNFQGIVGNENSSVGYTGSFTAEAVGEYTLDINCDDPCPIFPQTSVFLNFEAPEFYTSAPEAELAGRAVGFGPYKQVEWTPGVSFTQEAHEDYVPAGDHFEFQKPLIPNVTWLWRAETTVMTAMVEAGEADIAWDVGVDAVEALGDDQIESGGSAEVYSFWFNTLWHPELKKKKVRQAIAHAVNCQELVDTLYGGFPPCRGNIIFPGVVGATEENTAPYEYNPALAKQLLQEADYNPQNVIRMGGRSARIPKQVEGYEAIHGYLTAVGMNIEIDVMETAIWQELRQCAIGKAVNEVLEAQGKDPSTDEPTLADMQAALDKGGSNCPTAHMLETGGVSSETLDFGRQVINYMNCIRPVSFVCDPSPGGIQEQIAPALAASGEERRRRMEALADRLHDDVLFLSLFDLPVFYAVDPKLNWEPRFDRRIRVNTMWFSP